MCLEIYMLTSIPSNTHQRNGCMVFGTSLYVISHVYFNNNFSVFHYQLLILSSRPNRYHNNRTHYPKNLM